MAVRFGYKDRRACLPGGAISVGIKCSQAQGNGIPEVSRKVSATHVAGGNGVTVKSGGVNNRRMLKDAIPVREVKEFTLLNGTTYVSSNVIDEVQKLVLCMAGIEAFADLEVGMDSSAVLDVVITVDNVVEL